MSPLIFDSLVLTKGQKYTLLLRGVGPISQPQRHAVHLAIEYSPL